MSQVWSAPGEVPPPPPASKKSHKLRTTLIVLGVLFVIGLALPKDKSSNTSSDSGSTDTTSQPSSGSGVSSSNSGNHPAADDVSIASCSSEDLAGTVFPKVTISITNHTSKRSNYMVQFTLLDASGTKVGDGVATSNNVEAGQSSTDDGLATASSEFTKCHLVSVTRYAA